MAEIKVNINGIDDALDRLKKLETLCKSASMKKIPHGDVSGQVINQLTDISNIYLDMYSSMATTGTRQCRRLWRLIRMRHFFYRPETR